MKTIAKVTPTKVGMTTALGSLTKKDMNMIKHNKAKPTIPITELGIRNKDACQDSMTGPQEINGFKLQDGT